VWSLFLLAATGVAVVALCCNARLLRNLTPRATPQVRHGPSTATD
jgi:hypothetical protein